MARAFPFGCSGSSDSDTGFIYQNLPAFSVGSGDFIRFDTGLTNDQPLNLRIELATTTSNGSIVANALGFTTVATGTPLNSFGDTVIGNFDLAFPIISSFNR